MIVQFHFVINRDESLNETNEPVSVGWFLVVDKGAILFDAPYRMKSPIKSNAHAKSASRCPAVLHAILLVIVLGNPPFKVSAVLSRIFS